MTPIEITIPLTAEALPLEAARGLHAHLADFIAKLEADMPTTLTVSGIDIELAKGERYAGLILNDDGRPGYHLILLPGEAQEVSWPDAIEWAKKAGGELPTRREQALLFANLKSEFQAAWYWSGEQSSADHAWNQYFGDGNQYYGFKSYEGRARAVRRLTA